MKRRKLRKLSLDGLRQRLRELQIRQIVDPICGADPVADVLKGSAILVEYLELIGELTRRAALK